VLATRAGRPLSQRNVTRAVEEAGKAAKLGKVTPHTLRRSFASLAARRGVDPVMAARMTGHSWRCGRATMRGTTASRSATRRGLACSGTVSALHPSPSRSRSPRRPACIALAFRRVAVGAVYRKKRKAPHLRGFRLSGRRDLNSGPLVPQTSALTRLRHAPRRAHPSAPAAAPQARRCRVAAPGGESRSGVPATTPIAPPYAPRRGSLGAVPGCRAPGGPAESAPSGDEKTCVPTRSPRLRT
jgi:Phage integrase family